MQNLWSICDRLERQKKKNVLVTIRRGCFWRKQHAYCSQNVHFCVWLGPIKSVVPKPARCWLVALQPHRGAEGRSRHHPEERKRGKEVGVQTNCNKNWNRLLALVSGLCRKKEGGALSSISSAALVKKCSKKFFVSLFHYNLCNVPQNLQTCVDVESDPPLHYLLQTRHQWVPAWHVYTCHSTLTRPLTSLLPRCYVTYWVYLTLRRSAQLLTLQFTGTIKIIVILIVSIKK